MPFTIQELNNIANAALDFIIKGPALRQDEYQRPLFDDLVARQRYFPGGKDYVERNITLETTTVQQWYEHDDTVGYGNPANILRVRYPWREGHAGISWTLTEMKKAGIGIAENGVGQQYTADERVAITNLMEEKFNDLEKGYKDGLANVLWADGTANPKAPLGVTFMVTTTPDRGVAGGLNRAVYPRWRNHVALGIQATAANAADMPVAIAMDNMHRAINLYGGRVTNIYAGRDYIEAVERERRAKGYLTDSGWSRAQDVSVGESKTRQIRIQHDSAIDRMGLSKHCFMLNLSSDGIELRPVKGHDGKSYAPSRPPEKYVFYRAIGWTGCLACWSMNTHGRLSIA